MWKEFAISVSVYSIVALAVMFAAYLSNGDVGPPTLLALVLLVPLYLWERSYAKKVELSKKADGKSLGAVVGWALTLFFLALLVRIPSVLLFDMPYEKVPLIYLLILTIILVEKTDPSAFGFKTKGMTKGLLYGVLFFTTLQGTILFVHCIMVYTLLNRLAISSFDAALFLLNLPFQVLLVGVSEEGLFRGYIQTSMERFGGFRAILFQAVLFGLWHFVWDLSPFNLLDMLQYIAFTFLFGLLFGYFYSRARSLVPLFLVHGLWNSFQYGMIMNNEVLDTLAQASLLSQVLVWFLPYAVAFPAMLLFTKHWVKEV